MVLSPADGGAALTSSGRSMMGALLEKKDDELSGHDHYLGLVG
jgi:hypothetical protein